MPNLTTYFVNESQDPKVISEQTPLFPELTTTSCQHQEHGGKDGGWLVSTISSCILNNCLAFLPDAVLQKSHLAYNRFIKVSWSIQETKEHFNALFSRGWLPGNLNLLKTNRARGFNEGTAILRYSDETKGGQTQLCCHGKDYNDCCGKTNQNTAPVGIDSELQNESYPGHCHRNGQPAVDRKARHRLIIASVLCLFFMIGEAVGGYLADSLAIMTDAAHLLTDFASFMISLFALFVATRPSSKRMNFGWYRAEVIGALTSVLLIWVITGVLVYLAVERIITGTYEIDAEIMLITSGAGVAVNILMGVTLHTHGHSHGGVGSSHGHSHGNNEHQEEGHEHHSGTNLNVRAAFIHVIGDFIQSIGVFIAALVIYFKPNWGIVDPICTFLFSVLVLLTTFAIMKDTLTVLMEGLPKGVDFNDVHKTFFAIEGVVQVHNLRIWSLSMDKIALSAHVVVNPGTNPQDVLKRASQIVRQKYSFFEMTLQIEDMKDEMNSCAECQGPN